MQYLNHRALIVLVLLLLLCTACGPNIIRGRPPFVSIASLTLGQQQLTAVFSISNQNGEPMDITGIEIIVKTEQTELTRYDENLRLTIDANSTEDLTVERLPDELTRNLLNSLESGDLISLPFDLDGRVNTVADGTLKIRNKGHLYPVPGRPGQFRSATTHSSRIDGEDPFKEIQSRN